MDTSGIEATQALVFDDEFDEELDEEALNKPAGYLSVPLQKGFSGKRYPVFEGENIIGRGEECKICIPLKALSREHACIEIHGDQHLIYDKGSRNRSRRNKHFLAASVRYELKDQDQLVFGDVECVYQLNSEEADDSDETGSEGMFETAPTHEELDDTEDNKKKTENKPPDDKDDYQLGFESDASSDILEPTQPFNGNTQSMLLSKTAGGNTTFGQNVTVQDTPAPNRTKCFTDGLVLPESGSETEDEEEDPKGPPDNLTIPDSQGGDDDMKSRLMGAATQAYVCESDVTTDEEDNVERQKSLLMAPTQAFVDDDVSTCSEDSPAKRSLLMAATQAYVADSDVDDDKSPVKRKILAEPTQAYDMDAGIEPTVAYDMVEDSEKSPVKRKILAEPTQAYDMDAGIEPTVAYDMVEDSEKTENQSGSGGILYEPTQAYLGKDSDDKDEDGQSDTSEEFVLEGDTDNEDNGDPAIMAAPTLAMDTQVSGGNSEESGTFAIGEEATQVIDDRTSSKHTSNIDETVAITEAETQAFNDSSPVKSSGKNKVVLTDDATQVFNDDDDDKVDADRESRLDAETQLFAEEHTQVFEDTSRPGRKSGRKMETVNEETQVFGDDSTQVFDDDSDNRKRKSDIDDKSDATQVFNDDSTKEFGGNIKISDYLATQVFDDTDNKKGEKNDNVNTKGQSGKTKEEKVVACDLETQAFSDDEGNTFDINAAATMAAGDDTGGAELEHTVGFGDATQAFDDADATVAVQDEVLDKSPGKDDATQVFNEETAPIIGNEKIHSPVKGKVVNSEDATQVFEDATAPIQDEKTPSPVKRKVVQSDDATQVFHEEDDTLAISDENVKSPVKTRDQNLEDATQVFDGNTLAVDEITMGRSSSRGKKTKTASPKISKKITRPSVEPDDATQVFEETDKTVAISDVTETVEEKEEQDSRIGVVEDATQVFDETMPVKETTKKVVKTGKSKKGKKQIAEEPEVDSEAATQVFEAETAPIRETVVEESETNIITAIKVENKTGDVSDTNDKETRKSRRGRGKTQVEEITTSDKTDTKEGECRPTRNRRSKKSDIEPVASASTDVPDTEENITEVVKETDDVVKTDKVVTEVSTKGAKGKKGKGKAVKEEPKKSDDNEKEATETNVSGRRGGRARGKKTDTEISKTMTETSKPLIGRGTRGKKGVEAVEEPEKRDEQAVKKNTRTTSPMKKSQANVDTEEPTQAYGDDSDTDGAATQMYGNDDDDDATPDLNELTPDEAPPVIVVATASKSPLKSSLASPKKDRTPSPKKVQFVSQNSETSSESSQTSRRSNRGRTRGVKMADTDEETEDTKVKPIVTRGKVSRKDKETIPVVPEARTSTRRGRRSLVPETNTASANEDEESDDKEDQVIEDKSESTVAVGRTKARRGRAVVKEESDKNIESKEAEKQGVEEKTKVKPEAKIKNDSKGKNEIIEDTTEIADKLETKSRRGRRGAVERTSTSKSPAMETATASELPEVKEVGKAEHEIETKENADEVKLSTSRRKKVEKETKTGKPGVEPDVVTEKRTGKRGNVSVEPKASSEIDNPHKEEDTSVHSRSKRGKKSISEEEHNSRETDDANESRRSGRKNIKTMETDRENMNDEKTSVNSDANTARNRRNKGAKAAVQETEWEIKDVKTVTEKSDTGSAKTERPSRSRNRRGGEEENSEHSTEKEKHTGETKPEDIPESKSKSRTKDKTKETHSSDKKTEETETIDSHKRTTGARGRKSKTEKDTVIDDSAGVKENEEATSTSGPSTLKQRGRVKRKESDTSSGDSQETDADHLGKRRKTETCTSPVVDRRARNVADTPKHANKRVSIGTPKNSGKLIETEVMNSPTLRKTTTDGNKAKVMFTGVVDEQGEKIVKELGGELVSSVTECTHLVTDQVRRTVKFLCCVSRGIPIVSPQWLSSSKNSGLFSDPTPFLIHDDASEKKHKFGLKLSLSKANERQLLSGYKIHVTKSVKPEPQHMKDILKCAGAQYLATIPKTYLEGTLIVSCVDDKALCEGAVKADIPVVNSEFVLTGILRQEVDINSYRIFGNGNGNKRGSRAIDTTEPANKKRRK